jgi:hypothetical protein
MFVFKQLFTFFKARCSIVVMLTSGGSIVAEHSPHRPKVKVLSPPIAGGIRREKSTHRQYPNVNHYQYREPINWLFALVTQK